MNLNKNEDLENEIQETELTEQKGGKDTARAVIDDRNTNKMSFSALPMRTD